MSHLADFLKEEARRGLARPDYFEKQRKDWQSAVDRLLTQIEEWLRVADSEGVLHLERINLDREEYGLGSYTVPGLVVHLGSLRVDLIPIARNTLGLERSGAHVGRVAGKVQMTDGCVQYTLYRYRGAGEEWYIVDPIEYVSTKLDRSIFEAAMVNLLK